MQGTEATFEEVSFEGGDSPRRMLQKVLPGAAAVALAGAVGVCALHLREMAAPAPGYAPPAHSTAIASKPFGDIVIDANLLAEMKRAAPAQPYRKWRASKPLHPLPTRRSRCRASRRFRPLRHPRKPRARPCRRRARVPKSARACLCRRLARRNSTRRRAAPARHPLQPSVATAPPAAPVDNRSVFQKLFGLGQPSAPAVASVAPASGVASRTASSASAVASASAATENRGGAGRGPLFSFPSPFGGSAPVSGYDRYTAVYDISARVVYLPDGTRLEAHSGLGEALDNPRYVSERARGPTPPHVYQLTLREGSFHGVQALRLNPVGEGGIYGRAGLLAHPFMLGPNGNSNGCVSVKDYEAFLKAYENGQINKLAVVAKL